MATIVDKKYDERRWVFADQGLFGNLFGKALPLCAGKQLNNNNCTLLKDIFELKNYEYNYTQTQKGADDGDVPAQVTDFIIAAAYYAREIDTPSNTGGTIKNNLNNDKAKKMYENALINYANMDPSTQQFYDRYIDLIRIKGKNGNEEIISKDTYISVDDYDKYRINFRKTVNNTITILEHDLPYIADVVIYYTTNTGKIVTYNNKNKYIIKYLFNYIYNNIRKGFNNIATNYDDAIKNLTNSGQYFKLQADELILKRLFKINKAEVGIPEPKETKHEQEYFDLINGNIWFRDNGKFYKMENGKKIDYNSNDPATIDLLKAKHKCYGSLIKGTEATCNLFMYECLLNSDSKQIQTCYNKLKTQGFEKSARDEINNMHPIIAVRILQKLGFRKYKVYDNKSGMQLYKIENVDHWLAKIGKDEKITDDLKDDTGLILEYLNLLVQFVNANPGILNKGVTGETDESVGNVNQSAYLTALGIKQRIEPTGSAKDNHDICRFRKGFGSNYFNTTRKNTPFGNLSGTMGMAIAPGMQMIGVQRGGNYIIDSGRRCDDGVHSPVLMRNIFDDLKSDLANKGKTLDKKSLATIEKVLDQVQFYDNEANKMLAVIQEYNDLLYSLKQDYNAETLSYDKLTKFTDRYGRLQDRYKSAESYSLKIIELLQQLTSDEGFDDEYKQLTFDNGN